MPTSANGRTRAKDQVDSVEAIIASPCPTVLSPQVADAEPEWHVNANTCPYPTSDSPPLAHPRPDKLAIVEEGGRQSPCCLLYHDAMLIEETSFACQIDPSNAGTIPFPGRHGEKDFYVRKASIQLRALSIDQQGQGLTSKCRVAAAV